MNDQFETINKAISIISNLFRKLEAKETTIGYLQNEIDNRDEAIDIANERIANQYKSIDSLTKEIGELKKKEEIK